MRTGKYWVGQIPAEPLTVEVKDQDGRAYDLRRYDDVILHVSDSRNDPVDIDDGQLVVEVPEAGVVSFFWPEGQSVFNRPGEYVLRLELRGEGVVDYTSQFTILVREFGEVLRN